MVLRRARTSLREGSQFEPENKKMEEKGGYGGKNEC